MAVSQSDIDALTVALANGERMVKSGDTLVEYRSVDELLKARNALLAQQAAESAQLSGVVRPKQILLAHGGRGFGG